MQTSGPVVSSAGGGGGAGAGVEVVLLLLPLLHATPKSAIDNIAHRRNCEIMSFAFILAFSGNVARYSYPSRIGI